MAIYYSYLYLEPPGGFPSFGQGSGVESSNPSGFMLGNKWIIVVLSNFCIVLFFELLSNRYWSL